MSESSDSEMIMMYQSFINEGADYHAPGSASSLKGNKNNKVNREMGYISTVRDAKEILEKIYNQS